MEFAVGVVENDSAADLKDFACGSEFSAADGGEFVIILGPAAMAGSLAGSQTDHASFDSAIVVEAESASEAPGFIVGVSGDAHEAAHEVILSPFDGDARDALRKSSISALAFNWISVLGDRIVLSKENLLTAEGR